MSCLNIVRRTLCFRCHVLIAMAMLAIAGCSRGNEVALFRVSGKATCGGKPLERLCVHFEPQQKGRASIAVTNSEGVFELQYSKEQLGALPGEHIVWVELLPASPQEEFDLQSGKLVRPLEQRKMLEKYGASKTSPLKVNIEKDKQDVSLKLD